VSFGKRVNRRLGWGGKKLIVKAEKGSSEGGKERVNYSFGSGLKGGGREAVRGGVKKERVGEELKRGKGWGRRGREGKKVKGQ